MNLSFESSTSLPPMLPTGSGLRCNSRFDNRDQWNKTLLHLSYVPSSYTNSSIDYQILYQSGHGGDWRDISMVLLHDNRPCGVWPLSLSIKDGAAFITSHGLPVLPPLFACDLHTSIRKKIVKLCLDFLEELCRESGIYSWESIESYSLDPFPSLSEWHIESMRRGAKPALRHELFVDLSLDIPSIKARFRKSYKPLISSGNRYWDVDIMSSANRQVWTEFRQLHLISAGRQTRSDESWDAQHHAISEGNAFFVYLRNPGGIMVGGGFFTISRDESHYVTAAYDRSLFSKPLGHVVQFRAIEEMKNRGLRWYKLGERPYPSDSPSQKELSIAVFKEGFATHLLPQYHLKHACQ